MDLMGSTSKFASRNVAMDHSHVAKLWSIAFSMLDRTRCRISSLWLAMLLIGALGLMEVSTTPCFGQDLPNRLERTSDLEPWEPEDLIPASYPIPEIVHPARLPKVLCLKLIHWYQADISPRSIERCPFSPSCSNFAEQAIEQHGFLLGLCLFIDRNIYRENPQISQLYELIQLPNGQLKLDDFYFLNPGGRNK